MLCVEMEEESRGCDTGSVNYRGFLMLNWIICNAGRKRVEVWTKEVVVLVVVEGGKGGGRGEEGKKSR